MLYTPGEISAKVDGVTVRIIADLAEKKFITPVKETSGPGTARLYDKTGILRIMLFTALRGVVERELQLEIIEETMKFPDVDKIIYNHHLDYLIDDSWSSTTCVNIRAGESCDTHLTTRIDQSNPKSYTNTVIDVAGMRRFIDKNF